MKKPVDMIGKKYGRLTCIRLVRKCPKTGAFTYLFSCSCGNEKEIVGASVRRGLSTSCGCLNRQRSRERMTTHGCAAKGRQTKEYKIWAGIISRCENKKVKGYENYGGRGIKMCGRWRESFSAFLSDMGRCPAGLTIDRVNNDGNYEPGNCRWATKAEQAINRRSRRPITHNGQTHGLAWWARYCGVSESSMRRRFDDPDLSTEEAIATAIKLAKSMEKS